MTRTRLLVSVVGLALLLGAGGRVLVRVGVHLPHGDEVLAVGQMAKALGAPWLAAAWGLGAVAGSRLRGSVAGGAALMLGTLIWYLLTVAAAGRGVAAQVLPVATAWAIAASLAGGVFGLAGAAWRDGSSTARALSVAVLAGALAGEAVLLAGEWSGRAARAVLVAEFGAALLLLAAFRRRVPVALTFLLFAVIAVMLAGLEDTVRDALRVAGWGGP
jgi:hypothetical protein